MSQGIKGIFKVEGGLKIEWVGGETQTFSYLWLRDHAQDEMSFDHQTHQRLTYTAGIEPDIQPVSWSLESSGATLSICWPGTASSTDYDADYLFRCASEMPTPFSKAKLWGMQCVPPDPELEFEFVLGAGFADFLDLMITHGFVHITNCPPNEASVRKLVGEIGYVRETVFGGIWTFESNQAMADSAYSSEELRPHTDGSYSLDAPGLQLLLCQAQGEAGGDSILVDGFAVAKEIRQKQPELFKSLCRIPVTGIYKGEGRVLRATRPVFRQSSADSGLEQITFNNYDRDTLKLSPEDTQTFYRGLYAIENLLNDPRHQWHRQLQVGEMLIFDNWRILHGRRSFSGHRKMVGCYINREDYLSALEPE